MRWKDHLFDPSDVGNIWPDRRDGYIIIDTEFMPSKLWVSVPELAWYADSTGVIWLRFDEACQLFLDLFSLPVVKGPNWPADAVPVSDYSISPAPALIEQGMGSSAFEHDRSRLGDDNSSAVRATSEVDQEC